MPIFGSGTDHVGFRLDGETVDLDDDDARLVHPNDAHTPGHCDECGDPAVAYVTDGSTPIHLCADAVEDVLAAAEEADLDLESIALSDRRADRTTDASDR